jgi:hypothetical protein
VGNATYYQESKTLKLCPSCMKDLPLIAFPKAFKRPTGRASHCRDCRKSRYPYKPKAHKIAHLRNRYGLEWEDYLDLYEGQNKVCAICQTSLVLENDAHVDHCHKTNKVRGLLCFLCNSGIGKLRDNPDLLRRAAEYVEKHGAKAA